MKKITTLILLLTYFYSCTPMKSSPKEEKHQLELTLHEVQTNLDDLRHDLNCFQTEMQIIDGKVKRQEDSVQNLKQQHIEKLQTKIEYLTKQINILENKNTNNSNNYNDANNNLNNLINHANETTTALTQYKEKITELENFLFTQNKKIEELSKIKNTLDDIVQTIKINNDNYLFYKVEAKDSLEKIAKKYKVTIEIIKQINDLESDLIVVGQKLKIPKK